MNRPTAQWDEESHSGFSRDAKGLFTCISIVVRDAPPLQISIEQTEDLTGWEG